MFKQYLLAFGFSLLAVNSHSAPILVDETPLEPGYTTINGLDWLDWDKTVYMTASDALSKFSGWRLATHIEATTLMEMAFGDIAYSSEGVAELNNSYRSVYDSFASLFGVTCNFCSRNGVYAQVFDYGSIGVRDQGDSIYAFDGYTYLLGIKMRFQGYTAEPTNGIALVRNVASVDAPSTIALLSLAVFGAGLFVRKGGRNFIK